MSGGLFTILDNIDKMHTDRYEKSKKIRDLEAELGIANKDITELQNELLEVHLKVDKLELDIKGKGGTI